jgi:hypothetical protein
MSQPPLFDQLKSPSPDQTTISQHFSSATRKGTDPCEKMSKNGHIRDDNKMTNYEVNIN